MKRLLMVAKMKIFDIQQGVGIILLVKNDSEYKKISYFDVYGLREEKYEFLETHDINSTDWKELQLKEPNYFFVPKDTKGEKTYQQFISLKDIFKKYNAGIATGKDDVLVDFDKGNLARRLSIADRNAFELLMQNYKIDEDLVKKWCEKLIGVNIGEQIKIYDYRPFDKRFVIYNSDILQRARGDIMNNFLKENLGIVTTKNSKLENFDEVFVINSLTDKHLTGHQTFVFPLFIYSDDNGNSLFEKTGIQQSNFNSEFWQKVKDTFIETLDPYIILNYIYAVLYSNIYRQKYNEFLKIDFPKIPFAGDAEIFYKVAGIGKELVDLHLLKSERLENVSATFPVVGDNKVKKREYHEDGQFYINDIQYFGIITPEVWNYHIGGYQVLDKWIKDRVGRHLSEDDVNHFLKMITSLNWTVYFQKEVDKLYPEIEKSLTND